MIIPYRTGNVYLVNLWQALPCFAEYLLHPPVYSNRGRGVSTFFEVEGAAGAGFDAEAAFVTDGFGEADILECGHHPPDAAAGEAEGAHFGCFTTYPDTAATENAAAAVKNKGFSAIIN